MIGNIDSPRNPDLVMRHDMIQEFDQSGKSAVEWVGEIADSSWVAEGPASTAMTPFKKA